MTSAAIPSSELATVSACFRPAESWSATIVTVAPASIPRSSADVRATGRDRRSESLTLEGRHLVLDGDRPHVKIRQRVRRRAGTGLVVGPLKSGYARRDLLIPLDLADRLRALGTPDDKPAFTSTVGTLLDADNLAERVLAPACSEAGVEWAGFHTFRHTVASRLFAAGRTPRAGAALARPSLGELHARHVCPPARTRTSASRSAPQGANTVRTDPTPIDATAGLSVEAETP